MIDVYKALSDITRRKIIELLKERDMIVSEITENFNISQPGISQHLSILKSCGLIESKKEGKYVIYSLNLTVLQELVGWFHEEKSNVLLLSFVSRLLVWLLFYAHLPEQVAMHFVSNGLPDQYENPYNLILLLSAFLLLLTYFFTLYDKKNPNKQKINIPITIFMVIFTVIYIDIILQKLIQFNYYPCLSA